MLLKGLWCQAPQQRGERFRGKLTHEVALVAQERAVVAPERVNVGDQRVCQMLEDVRQRLERLARLLGPESVHNGHHRADQRVDWMVRAVAGQVGGDSGAGQNASGGTVEV